MLPPKKILAATDFSASAAIAVDAAIAFAQRLDAQLGLVHVVPLARYVEFADGMAGTTFNSAEFQTAVREGIIRLAQAEVARVRALGIAVEMITVDGPPAWEICRCATEQGYDLIVVGSHGRTGLKRLLLGSVAENVVRHATVPVLTVRT